MYAVVAEFRVKPDRLEEWTALLDAHAERCRTLEPACLQFDVTYADGDPTLCLLYEVYANADGFEAHRNTAHFPIFFEAMPALVEDRKVRRFLRRPGA